MTNTVKNNTGLIAVCVTLIICFTLSICAAVFIAVPNGANTGSLIAIIMASLPGSISAVVALIKATEIKNDTEQMLNGTMDRKIQRNVHTAMDDRANTQGSVTES